MKLIAFLVPIALVIVHSMGHPSAESHRSVRGAVSSLPTTIEDKVASSSSTSPSSPSPSSVSPNKNQPECRYEKGTWEECDASSTVQKRVLNLKKEGSSAECAPEKVLTRPCKKSCRYAKGVWGECVDGIRSRTDQLKVVAAGCEDSRIVSRKCKPVCRYGKSDWEPCVEGVKKKTLSLVEGKPGDCEASKVITKQCVAAVRSGPRKNRKSSPPSEPSA